MRTSVTLMIMIWKLVNLLNLLTLSYKGNVRGSMPPVRVELIPETAREEPVFDSNAQDTSATVGMTKSLNQRFL